MHAYFAGEPLPPQELKSEIVGYATNYLTVNITWNPPLSNYTVDFYCYQVITGENVTDNIIFNTTENVVMLSEIPRDVETLFVISAYHCGKRSTQVILNITGR